MTLKYDDLIARYFEHKMTPQEEQNFLISLAASDEMRLQFRSHLELMKAIRQDKDDMRPVAQVRARTLATLGLSTAVVSQFLEHGIIHSEKAAEPVVQTATLGSKSNGLWNGLGRIFRNSIVALGSGLVIGFAGALSYFGINSPSDSQPEVNPSAAVSTPGAITPSAVSTTEKPSEFKIVEPAESSNLQQGTKGVAAPEKPTASSKVNKSISETESPNPATLSTLPPEQEIEHPAIKKSGQGIMKSKVVIKKPTDSSRKE